MSKMSKMDKTFNPSQKQAAKIDTLTNQLLGLYQQLELRLEDLAQHAYSYNYLQVVTKADHCKSLLAAHRAVQIELSKALRSEE